MTITRDGDMMRFDAPSMTMPLLAKLLRSSLGRPVVDMTGLKGNYHIALDVPKSGGSPSDISLNKLGLKLETRKAPIDFIVVDHAERSPAPN